MDVQKQALISSSRPIRSRPIDYETTEYTFVNPRGERVTRSDRLANLRAGRTAFDSIAHAPQEEEILTYGDGEVAVYTTLLKVAVTATRASAASSAP